ncbi:cytochrome P450 [Raphidocelis subcapitata]|uniref:Cytochrome P450 n=1 Tax=Raphidocelis subcapitata TaxID=307507 RepID=A0A2V0P219_9CHLO|nr:cytochrome P450 [Raphidocelis subcapitata]|eukprot:GBF92932.1 cytochrome P450 [Raphidocelis subcapitata]
MEALSWRPSALRDLPVARAGPRSPARPLRLRIAAAAAAGPRAAPATASGGPGAPRPPPRPRGELPLLLHAPSMAAHISGGGNLETLLQQWLAECGPVFEWQVPGGPPVLVLTNPETIREVYEVQQLHKSPRYADLLPLLGAKSLLLTEGEVWRAQRDAFNPGFASAFLRDAVPQFVEAARHLVARLDAAADAAEAEARAGGGSGAADGGAASGAVVKMHDLAILVTLEIILSVGFGERIDFLDPKGPGVQHPLFDSFVKLGRHVSFFLDNPALNFLKNAPWSKARTAALQRDYEAQITAVLTRRLAAMGIEAPEAGGARAPVRDAAAGGGGGGGGGCPVLHGPPAAEAEASAAAAAAAAAGGGCPVPHGGAALTTSGSGGPAAPGAEAAPPRGGSPWSDLARGGSPAPEAARAGGAAGGGRTILDLAVGYAAGSGGGGLDVDTLRDQLMTFFAAGHDTTASLVAWTVNFLCIHPEAEARLAEEVAAVLGDDAAEDAGPSWQQLNEMRWLTAVLKETLRLRPPVGVLARWAPEGSVLECGGVHYEASNKVILVSPFLQQTDPAVWGADAHEWRPERWLDPAGAAEGANAYSYMPFSRGPRDCIGSRFALLEAKVILAMVYRRFSLRYALEGREEVMFSVTAHPKNGLPVRVERRRR